ncbi:MAG TPA: hypothetical protein VI957_01760 [Candidatus Paceibacterota bacterium]
MAEITDRPRTGTWMRALAILAFVVILIIGIWGSIQIARMVPNAFSNLSAAFVGLTSIFVPANETLTLSAPSLTVSSGETFLLSWEHSNKATSGSYTFRYNCVEGVSFTSPNIGGAQTAVFCNTPFNFLNANDAIILTASSSKSRLVDVELFIDFTPNGVSESTITGTATLTIANNAISGTPVPTTPVVTAPAPTAPVTTIPPPQTATAGTATSNTFPIGTGAAASNPSGFIDLTGRVIEVGIVNKTTNEFTASSTPMRNPPGARLAIRFAVENVGTKRSSMFDFNAVLPTFPAHIFSSPMQQELGPGDRIEFTLAFDSFVDATSSVFTLNIDPSSRIMEPNKANNILKYTMTVVK